MDPSLINHKITYFPRNFKIGLQNWVGMANFALVKRVRIDYSGIPSRVEPVELPLSKSVSARVCALDFLAGREPRMHAEPSGDELVFFRALSGAFAAAGSAFDLGESGTAMRLLTAIFASLPGRETVLTTDSRRLPSRPMEPLFRALEKLGAAPLGWQDETLPVEGRQLVSSGEVEIDCTESSQFASALLLIGPKVRGGLQLRLKGAVVSRGYIDLTLALMRRYGARIQTDGNLIRVEEGRYFAPPEYCREPDWSAASYLLEFVVAAKRKVPVSSRILPSESLQPDAGGLLLFEQIGAKVVKTEEGISVYSFPACGTELLEADLSGCPDLVPALAGACVAAGKPFRFSGIGHLRLKECDRLGCLASNMSRLGADLWVEADALEMPEVPVYLTPRLVESCGDHRMVMALAAMAPVVPVMIDSPEAVTKSWPGFWREMAKIGITAEPWS